jgi:hypothetical protein
MGAEKRSLAGVAAKVHQLGRTPTVAFEYRLVPPKFARLPDDQGNFIVVLRGKKNIAARDAPLLPGLSTGRRFCGGKSQDMGTREQNRLGICP